VVRCLVCLIGRHLDPNNERQRGEVLTGDEALKLSDRELELLAEGIIQHHTYLFEDQENPNFE